MNVRPAIIRTRTPIPVPTPVPPEVLSLRSQTMPGRIIKVWRTDGMRVPLLNEDYLFLAQLHFREHHVQHFCSYRGEQPARYDAVLEPLRYSDA